MANWMINIGWSLWRYSQTVLYGYSRIQRWPAIMQVLGFTPSGARLSHFATLENSGGSITFAVSLLILLSDKASWGCDVSLWFLVNFVVRFCTPPTNNDEVSRMFRELSTRPSRFRKRNHVWIFPLPSFWTPLGPFFFRRENNLNLLAGW